MRARLALYSARLKHEHREILLRNKPKTFLQLSEKGTVPVLLTNNGKLIEESIDIMIWALKQNDPENLLDLESETHFHSFIFSLDNDFKDDLDKYKYLYENDPNKLRYRNKACKFLQKLNLQINQKRWLFGNNPTIYDYATLPFIRQFANVDRCWFDVQPWPNLQRWLNSFLVSKKFNSIMYKYDEWNNSVNPIIIDFEHN